jgi:hypothetical protein
VLGSKAVRVVVGSDATGELREALLAVAKDWAADTTVTVVEERAGEALPDHEGGTWFLGEGTAARAFAEDDLPAPPADGAWVAAGRIEGRPDRPAGLLRAADASSVASIARKVPHYSKYSWLSFDGDRNVGKGVWDAGESPLVVKLPSGGGK